MNPLRIVTGCLLAGLFAASVAGAGEGRADDAAQKAFLLHEGGNMHTDQQALRERRARALEQEQREAYDRLMVSKYAIIHKYLARLPAAEREAMQAELAEQHGLFEYRYPDAHARLLQSNPHRADAATQ